MDVKKDMNMMLRCCIIVIMGLSSLSVYTQKDTAVDMDTLVVLFEKLYADKEIETKRIISREILNEFENVFSDSLSFCTSFDTISSLGVLTSPDSMIRIYNWNLPLEKGHHKYFGFIQCRDGRYFMLSDSSSKIKKPEQASLTHKNWYGALYYDIVVKEKNGKPYYFLLSFDFNDLFTSKKIIEVLYFDDRGMPHFGAPMFQWKKKMKNRIVFEFSAQVVMSLKYEKERDMIVFDHLSPREPKYQGIYHYYGPDFTFDALKFVNGRWKLVEDIDITF